MRTIARWFVLGAVACLAWWSLAVVPVKAAPLFQTPEPTEEPSPEPTEEPSPEPTEEPSPEPTEEQTPEPTEEPTTTPAGSGAPSEEPGGEETPASWWQWIVLGLLLVGGLAAMAAARRRPPSPGEVGEGREALLAQLQRLATRSSEVAATDDEIRYQRAAIGSLEPPLTHEIAVEPEALVRRDLEQVSSALRDLSAALKAARGTSTGSHERRHVHAVASSLSDRVAALRSPDATEDELGP